MLVVLYVIGPPEQVGLVHFLYHPLQFWIYESRFTQFLDII